MITLFDLWERMSGEVNTHQGGFVRPNRQFPNWVNDISLALFMEDYDVFQKTQVVTDRITIYLKSKPVKVIPGTATYDIVPRPPDYEYLADCRFYYKGDHECVDVPYTQDGPRGYTYNTAGLSEQKISVVDNMRWADVSKHRIKKPSKTKPFMTLFDKGFKLIPNAVGINFIVIDWFRLPVTGTFKYTLGPDDQIIYDAVNSQPLDWSATLVNEFVARLSMKYGKFIREQFIYQTSAQEKETAP